MDGDAAIQADCRQGCPHLTRTIPNGTELRSFTQLTIVVATPALGCTKADHTSLLAASTCDRQEGRYSCTCRVASGPVNDGVHVTTWAMGIHGVPG
jgi:hypothetical protein